MSETRGKHGRLGLAAAWGAALVGLAYAAVSAYWALGGTGLLDTVGGSIESWGRRRGATVLLALWAVVAVKVVAAALPSATYARVESHVARRGIRILGWCSAVVLAAYGLVLTAAGAAVQSGLVSPGPGADHRALAWHAGLWDPWFLLWGLLSLVAMRGASRRAEHPGVVRS